MTRTILVTGATGFLGSHTLQALARLPDVRVVAACRSPEKLPVWFEGEVRAGDLRDPTYRQEVVAGVDAVCHCGTWGAMYGHDAEERRWFYEPTVDLIERCIEQGVGRFLLASSVAIAARGGAGPIDDFTPTAKTGFWPHLDLLVELDGYMQARAGQGTQLVTMRLGHFVGRGNRLGLVPAIVPRLRTYLVPWLAGGRGRMPLVAGPDLGQGFALAATAEGLDDYESFNICGPSYPTGREVFTEIARLADAPTPWFSVPYVACYAFGWLMERLHPLLRTRAPFLTRAIVHIAEDWHTPTAYAHARLGYEPGVDWRDAVAQSVADASAAGFPWPYLNQEVP